MTSNVDVSVPVTGNPTTASVRGNFAVIKAEIEALQTATAAAIEGATYTHPANHAPSIITQDASSRFVTDAEKTAWGAKQPAGTYATGSGTASGTNTGDETVTTIKTKLSITTLSGSNTGDQIIPTTLPASDVYAWAKAATKPSYTPAEVGAQDVLVSGANIRTVNGNSLLGSTDLVIVAGGSITNTAYADRADLRTMSPATGDAAVVDGLGLFIWESGCTEPDDDESCFATASGCWLLEAAHWDLVDAWQSPELQALLDDDEDEPLRFASKVLTGSAICAITSVASINSTSFTGTVTGAAIGDRVIATPPAQLGTAADTGRLSYHAWVSTTNTVTVMLCNASAANATTNAAIQAAWPITVIKL